MAAVCGLGMHEDLLPAGKDSMNKLSDLFVQVFRQKVKHG